MDTSNERETFERAGSIADESIGTVASTMRASDSGTSSVATMRSVGDTGKTLSAYNSIDTAHGISTLSFAVLMFGGLMRNT